MSLPDSDSGQAKPPDEIPQRARKLISIFKINPGPENWDEKAQINLRSPIHSVQPRTSPINIELLFTILCNNGSNMIVISETFDMNIKRQQIQPETRFLSYLPSQSLLQPLSTCILYEDDDDRETIIVI